MSEIHNKLKSLYNKYISTKLNLKKISFFIYVNFCDT